MLNVLKRFNLEIISNLFLFILSLIPFFVSPFDIFLKNQSRFLLLSFFTFLVSIVLIVKSLKNHQKNIFFSKLDILLILLPIWYFFSFLFSIDKYRSFIGIGINTDSFFFIFIMSLVSIIVSLKGRTKADIRTLIIVLLFSISLFVCLVVMSLFLKFSFDTRYLNFFLSDNFISSFNDFSILSGVVLIASVALSHLKYFYGKHKLFLVITSFVSLVALLLVNLSINVFGILVPINFFVALFIIFYLVKSGHLKFSNYLSRFGFFVLIILLASSFFRESFNNYFAKIFNIKNPEVSLTWESNLKMVSKSLSNHPITGFGPNTFDIVWDRYKPLPFNLTDFWQTKIYDASSYLFNIFVTTGFFGFAIFAFILFFSFRLSIKSINKHNNSENPYDLLKRLVSIINIYLGFILIFYNPGFLIIFVFFVFLGILISIEKIDQMDSVYSLSFITILPIKFIKISLLCLFVLFTLIICKTNIASLSISLVDKVKNENIDERIKLTKFALIFDKRPEYLAILSKLQLTKAKSLYFSSKLLSSSENEIFNSYVQQSVTNIENSYLMNKIDYNTNLVFGDILFDIGMMGGQKAFDLALERYLEATVINPNNPIGLFLSAKTAHKLGRYDLTKSLLKDAIKLKINYTEAYFLLAINEEMVGNKKEALNLYNVTRSVSNNSDFYFVNYIAFLYRNNFKDEYNKIIEALKNDSNSFYILKEVDSIKDDKLEELEAYLII